ncbi:MAG TPA: glycine cleavage system aminomethyltransferase GcvT [Phaeodactylibacter sp.]|nr:glycine cleavage system aminomethyltransferase GcvT [Phaeodactylibacter sp.]
MKSTPLTQKHIELGAKMAEFAGYNMPISYAGIKDEHYAVRNSVGVFDVSHMGEFLVKGKGATEFVQKITSNNVAKLSSGDVQYSCFPNHDGGIVDDLLVYRFRDEGGEPSYMLVVNGSNIDKDWNWVRAHNSTNVELENISYQCGLLAVQGPKAAEALQALTDVDLKGIKYYNFKVGTFAGIKNIIISATGYTGSGGFELYADNKDLGKLWDAVMEAGKSFDIQPAGLGARDTLRLEMGFCLYGNDIDDTTSPIEAGLGWITKVKKGDFNSQPIFAKQKAEGVTKKLVAFVVEDRRVPRHGYLIEDKEENGIGVVTSGTQSPSLNIPIGMGYVKKEFAAVGTEILIVAGRKKLPAKVVKLPFLKIES